MNKVKIEYIDNIYFKVNEGLKLLTPHFSFTAEYWRQTQFRKQKTTYQKSLFQKDIGYCGWISEIKNICKKDNIQLTIIGEVEKLEQNNPPILPNVVFRDYQLEGISQAIKHQRGIIHAATGTGKSILAVGLISCFNSPKVLYLVPNLDLMNQVFNDFVKYGFDACKLGGGNKEISSPVVVSTVQTAVKLDLTDISDHFDIVIIDEAHLCVSSGATIEKIMSKLLAPVRISFTATLPSSKEKMLILTGMTGGVLFDMSAKEAIKNDILAIPEVRLLNVPKLKDCDAKTYQQFYKKAISNNGPRNKLICKTAIDCVNENRPTIIFVREIDHLDNICTILDGLKIDYKAVHGVISSEERNIIKQDVLSGKVKLIVSSIVWQTGLDLPLLSAIILGGAGRAETTILQTIGRGLRKDEGKDGCVIYDFLSREKYLAEHCVERIACYIEMGWL